MKALYGFLREIHNVSYAQLLGWEQVGRTPCKAPVVWPNGASEPRKRCRMHGGLSTGARTPEGRERCRQAALRRWAKYRAERAAEGQA